MGGSSLCRCYGDYNLAEQRVTFPSPGRHDADRRMSWPTDLFQSCIMLKLVLGLTAYKNDRSLYRRQSLPVRGPLPHKSWGQEQTTWWLSSPNTPTVWGSLFLPSNEPVSIKWRITCQQCNLPQCESTHTRQKETVLNLLQSCLFFKSSFRVFAEGYQSPPGPGRLLLSFRGLGSASVSCARLQTHLWTTRSATHTVYLFTCPSLSVCHSSDLCNCVLITLTVH